LPFVGATQLDLNSRIMEPSDRRFMASTEKRLFAPEMCLDAMCGGCRKHRVGYTFCYGCERDSYPHYHQDKTARTGGGFTYVKRDRPVREIVRNNPLSWRIVLDNGCVVYLDGEQAGDIERFATTIGSEHLLSSKQLHSDLESAAHTIQSDMHAHLKTTTPTSILSDSGHEDEGEEDYYDEEKEEDRIDLDDADERLQRNEMLRDDSRRQESLLEATEEIADDDEQAANIYNADQPHVKLYTAPKAFAIKKGNRKTISSTLPFTTDRDLKIPKYGNFDIQKSDKGPTEFVSIDRGDDSWQAPDAFALEGRENTGDNWTHGHLKNHESDHQVTRSSDKQLSLTSAAADTLTSPPTSKTKMKKTRSPKAVAVGTKDKHKKGRQQKIKGEGRAVTPDSGVGSVSNKPLPPIPPTSPLPEEQVSSAEAYNSSSLTSRQAADQQSDIGSEGDVSSASTHTEVDAMINEVAEQFVTTESSSIPKTPAISTADEPVIGQRPTPKTKADDESQHRRPKTKEAAKRERKPESVKRIKAKHDDEQLENKQDKTSEERNEEVVLTPEPFQPMVFKEHILPIVLPTKHVEHPPLPTASPPSLPRMMDFIEPVKPVREISVTQLEIPPPMMEPPRQRRPPPTLKPKSKPRRYVRPPTIRSGGAPIQVSDVKNMGDPLDFLAKYCIIHPDRLPHYVRVFNKAVNEQMYRYSDVPHPEGQFFYDDGHDDQTVAAATADVTDDELIQLQIEQEQLKTMLTEDEATKIRNFTAINPSLRPLYASVGMNEGDQTLAKINYTLDILMDKYEALQATQDVIAENQMNRLAYLARKHFPQLADPSYKPPKQKKKKKKRGLQNEEEGKCDEVTDVESVVPVKLLKLTDADIIKRLDDRQLQALNVDLELSRLNLELQRLQEKLQEVDDRIEELEDEKKLVQLYARDEFQRLELCASKSAQFLRQQSALYQKMHPACNVEMNVSDIEEALQEINSHLITKKEMQYIFHILNIPGRKRIDIQLFSVIAAMSEKVAQVDPFIRKLINKFDYDALNTKMDRSKELFCLLSDNETDVPLGKIAARMLAVELAAGGVTPEHTQYVLSKFNRENNGVVDILDFLTYVPLFIEIHDRILNAPLQLDREW